MADDKHGVPVEDEAFFEAVRRTAYFLWEQDGRPHGRHVDYYLRAYCTGRPSTMDAFADL